MRSAELCYPEGYRAADWALKGFEASSPVLRDDGRPSVCKIPRWLFVADGARIQTSVPVEVLVHSEDEQVVVECPRLHVFAAGSSVDSALDDLDHQVVHFYRRYTSLTDEQVTGLAARLRELYGKHFVVNRA